MPRATQRGERDRGRVPDSGGDNVPQATARRRGSDPSASRHSTWRYASTSPAECRCSYEMPTPRRPSRCCDAFGRPVRRSRLAQRPRSGLALTGAPADWNPPRRDGHRPSARHSKPSSSIISGPGPGGRRLGRGASTARSAARSTRDPGRADPPVRRGRLLDPRKESPHRGSMAQHGAAAWRTSDGRSSMDGVTLNRFG